MANKTNNNREQVSRPDRNADEGPRKERSSRHVIENSAFKKESAKSKEEHLSRKGYYSRNGGYGGYRGL